MMRHIRLVLCLIATLSIAGLAQIASSTSPAAFVYVSSSPSNNNYEINAFTAAPDGKLTASPDLRFLPTCRASANQQYLFGTNGVDIYSFSIAADGSLDRVANINAQKFNGYKCGGPVALFLDRTGKTVYDEDYFGNICANNTYQSFSIDSSTGELTYLKASAPSVVPDLPLSFLGNNVYAYGSSSHEYGSWLFGFKRNSNKNLKTI